MPELLGRGVTLYRPASHPLCGIVIFPGGGYVRVANSYEGDTPARLLAARGIAAVVVKYSVGPGCYSDALADAERALLLTRSLVAAPVGAMGFSAGAHLAGLLATGVGPRPDFLGLAYPVVALDTDDAHTQSRDNLCGADRSLWHALSLQRRVDAATPPTFLVHGGADTDVPCEHSVRFYAALRAAHVPAELHLFSAAVHGFGVDRDPQTNCWTDLFLRWLTGSSGMTTTEVV